MLITQVDHIHIVLLYIRLYYPRSKALEFFEDIRTRTRGPTVIMGDLNARHRKWDKRSNTMGNMILQWSERWSWTIQNADLPSFQGATGSSNVDLFITKGVRTKTTPWILIGNWDASSDHNPVVIEFAALAPRLQSPRTRIAWWKIVQTRKH